MKYTTWTPATYNGVTIYLTDAPANVRYTDPKALGICVNGRDTVISENGVTPDLSFVVDGRRR